MLGVRSLVCFLCWHVVVLGTLSQRDPAEFCSIDSNDDQDAFSSRIDKLMLNVEETEGFIPMRLGTGTPEDALSTVIVTSPAFVSQSRSFMKTSSGPPIVAVSCFLGESLVEAFSVELLSSSR